MGLTLLLAAAASLLVMGCGNNRMAPSALPSVTVTVPTLVSPVGGASVPQNSAPGCPAHPRRGEGSQISFDWTDSTSPNSILGYDLFAKRDSATIPIVDTFVAGSSEFLHQSCNAFVTDSNLTGWEWRVRARDGLGNLSEWTPLASFVFEACRLAGGAACSS